MHQCIYVKAILVIAPTYTNYTDIHICRYTDWRSGTQLLRLSRQGAALKQINGCLPAAWLPLRLPLSLPQADPGLDPEEDCASWADLGRAAGDGLEPWPFVCTGLASSGDSSELVCSLEGGVCDNLSRDCWLAGVTLRREVLRPDPGRSTTTRRVYSWLGLGWSPTEDNWLEWRDAVHNMHSYCWSNNSNQ